MGICEAVNLPNVENLFGKNRINSLFEEYKHTYNNTCVSALFFFSER